ncbi:helix-turn-helix domain-containing protein [Spirosoma migulaei]
MKNAQPHKLDTISAFHQFWELPKPEHPLISVINFDALNHRVEPSSLTLISNFYSIALKRISTGKLKYGQQPYDFDEGVMMFMAPGQVLTIETDAPGSSAGWLLLIHPDFLWHTPLAKTIRQYAFFSYAVHEALHLSEKEEGLLVSIIHQIEQEYQARIDLFSQRVMLNLVELLLTYSDRFYQRQFITRKITNHQLLNRLEAILTDYFNSDALARNGPPTVPYIADRLNVSPNYLSILLKLLTGQSTQHHIHDKLIERAKEKLSTTDLSISEIAYALGFEHAPSFSKLFKSKTNLSPLAFRQSFN